MPWLLEAWTELAVAGLLAVKRGPKGDGGGQGPGAGRGDAGRDLQRRSAQQKRHREDAEGALPHCFGFSLSRSRAF